MFKFEWNADGSLANFSPVLPDNPTSEQVLEYVQSKGAQGEEMFVVDAPILLRNGRRIPCKVLVKKGVIASVLVPFPPPHAAVAWGKRYEEALRYDARINPENEIPETRKEKFFRVLGNFAGWTASRGRTAMRVAKKSGKVCGSSVKWCWRKSPLLVGPLLIVGFIAWIFMHPSPSKAAPEAPHQKAEHPAAITPANQPRIGDAEYQTSDTDSTKDQSPQDDDLLENLTDQQALDWLARQKKTWVDVNGREVYTYVSPDFRRQFQKEEPSGQNQGPDESAASSAPNPAPTPAPQEPQYEYSFDGSGEVKLWIRCHAISNQVVGCNGKVESQADQPKTLGFEDELWAKSGEGESRISLSRVDFGVNHVDTLDPYIAAPISFQFTDQSQGKATKIFLKMEYYWGTSLNPPDSWFTLFVPIEGRGGN